ncbi:MAG: ABC transporter permease [Candidatus Eisenbacteria sp.]|nr:ABC transporter permease [Candidatus Eisenbacteria bacterium]
MRKVFKLAQREYLAAVRTKGFIIALVVVPIMMSGSGLAMALLKDRMDTDDKRIAILDRSGIVAQALIQAAELRNAEVAYDQETGKQVKSRYILEAVDSTGDDIPAMRLELSDRVREGELHAFLEIGPEVLHPGEEQEHWRIAYHAPNAVLDDIRRWLGGPINNHLRSSRLRDLGVAEEAVGDLFHWISVDALGLVTLDTETGEVKDARHAGKAETLIVPIVLPMLMFMMFMMAALPQISAVMEEKTQRIAEVLLGSVGPFQFMMGKVLGGVGVSLTGVAVYVIGGILTLRWTGNEEFIPYAALPWFIAFLAFAILMFGAMFAALGSACNDAKEAQSVTFPAMFPMMIPMFLLMPILQHPLSPLATALSLIPPCTPMVMVLRIASPVGIPAWQPWVALGLLLLSTVFTIWAGGRIFRIAILMQGTPPKLANLVRWAIRG